MHLIYDEYYLTSLFGSYFTIIRYPVLHCWVSTALVGDYYTEKVFISESVHSRSQLAALSSYIISRRITQSD